MTTEEKAVINAAIELHRTPGYLQYFHIVLGKLDGKTGELLRAREREAEEAKGWICETIDGEFEVMKGDDIMFGPIPDRAEADEYLAAMKRGDI